MNQVLFDHYTVNNPVISWT